MKIFYLPLIVFFGLIFCEGNIYCQVKISGRIIDENSKDPIGNVHIYEETGGQAIISDSMGNFQIHVPVLPVLLSISHLSYHPKAVLVQQGQTDNLSVELVSRNFQLNEVVVIAEKIQKFFNKETFYVKEMEFGSGFLWVIGYPDKNILKPELRVLSLGGTSLSKRNLDKTAKLFKDAYGEVHLDFDEKLEQLYWDGDSIQYSNTFIKDGSEEYFYSLQASFDSLAILRRKIGTGVYNEYLAFNFLDSSKHVFHYSFDHELFASSNSAKRHKYASIPTVIFPPFTPGRNARITASFDPTDGFTRNAQDRLLTFTPINSKLFLFDDHLVIFEDKGPFLWKYSLALESQGMDALQVPDKSHKLDLLQDPISFELYVIFENSGHQYISKVDEINGKMEQAIKLDGFTFVENIRVYGHRLYYLDQSLAGSQIMNLYSMAID